jgi:hypothetical protein
MQMLLIDNQRISDQSWSADMADALSEALRGADAGVMAEAYAYVGDDGNGVGPHHEVRDDVLIVNRQGVWQAMGELSYPAPPRPRRDAGAGNLALAEM